MRRRRLQVATLDEVTIARNGEFAAIDLRDSSLGGMNLKLGPQLAHMTDLEILDSYNDVVRTMENSVATYRPQ